MKTFQTVITISGADSTQMLYFSGLRYDPSLLDDVFCDGFVSDAGRSAFYASVRSTPESQRPADFRTVGDYTAARQEYEGSLNGSRVTVVLKMEPVGNQGRGACISDVETDPSIAKYFDPRV